MRLLFSAPSPDDLVGLLRAWRLWLLAALAGALLGAGLYWIAPPPYRARATVNVDFNLELAWPKETDRQQFYYLERETRKLEETAWSDAVLQAVADEDGKISVDALRAGKLQLSQPGEGGWHFFADDPDPKRAGSLASNWAQSFAAAARAAAGSQDGPNALIQVEVTQSSDVPKQRSVPLSAYLLVGTFFAWFVTILAVLFFMPPGSAWRIASAQ